MKYLPILLIISLLPFATALENEDRGNVYLIQDSITINKIILEDALLVGDTVQINAPIEDDLRGAAKTVRINAPIGGEVLFFAQQIGVGEDATIGQDAVIIAQTIDMRGTIENDAILIGKTVYLRGIIEDDATINAKELIIEPDAQILGDVRAQVERIEGDLDAITTGDTNIITSDNALSSSFPLWMRLASFLVFLLIGLLLLALIPSLRTKEYAISQHGLGSLLLGLLFYALTPIIILLLIFTLIGIPIAFILFFSAIILMYLAKMPVSLWLGSWAGRNVYVHFIVGWIILSILFSIPIVGTIAVIITGIMGVGAFFAATTVHARTIRLKKH